MGPSVTDDGLPTLVLTAEEVADALKAPGMFVNKTWTQPHGPLPGDSFDPPECTAAVFNGLTDAYNGSGYHAIYGLDVGQHTNGFPRRLRVRRDVPKPRRRKEIRCRRR